MNSALIDEINRTMHEGFEIPFEKLKPEATLFEELGLDSLDAVDMLVYLEEKFKVKVDGEKLKDVRTLQDIYVLVDEISNSKKPDLVEQPAPQSHPTGSLTT